MKHTLHIVANSYFLTDFLLDSIAESDDIKVIRHPKSRRGWYWSLLKFVETHLLRRHRGSLFFGKDYVAAFASVKPSDSVLFFGVDNIKELKIAKRLVPTSDVSVFVWNSVQDFGQSKWASRQYGKSLSGLGCRACTFDPNDAACYNLELVNQVYREVQSIKGDAVEFDNDVFFVGHDKGRLPVLREWHRVLTGAGMSVFFRVVRDKRRTYRPSEDVSFLSSNGLSYPETLQWIRRSRCLLDFAQENQSGLTVRALEAFFFNKKLITNNQTIVGSDLYHPSRVFVIGRDDPARIAQFIYGEALPVAAEVLRKHDFRHWCRQFFVTQPPEEKSVDGSESIAVHSMYWDNISLAIRESQHGVFAALGIPLIQENANLMPHGEWMAHVLARYDSDDVVVFCDIDAFPLTVDAYRKAIASAQQGDLFGLAQFSNHKRGQHLYAGPMFMAVRKSVWEGLGSPRLASDKRYDAAEGLSAVARQAGIQVQMVMPSACLIPKWPLANKGVFGIGTFYGECEFFHLFESRRAAYEPLLLNVAQDVINGRKPDFARYLELTSRVNGHPGEAASGRNWVPKPLRRLFARRPR